MEPALIMLEDKIKRVELSSTHTYNGQHSFLDFCRLIVAREMYTEKMEEIARGVRDNSDLRAATGGDEVNVDRTQPSDKQMSYRKVTFANERMAAVISQSFVDNNANGNTKDSQEEVFFQCDVESTGMGHVAFKVDRVSQIVVHDTMFENIYEHGPYIYPYKPRALVEIFEQARTLFENDSICIRIPMPVVIISDIRGRYIDLHRWLQVSGLPYRRRILFMGGLMDDNMPTSIECLALVAAMKVAYPKHVFLIRGASETFFKFQPRFGYRADMAILDSARRMCSYLPLAAFIGKRYLCVHSGISHQLNSFECFDAIHRPLRHENLPLLAKFLIFGQPTANVKMFTHDEAKFYFKFGMNAVENLCRNLGLTRIIRGRSVIENGSLLICNRKLLTLFSVPLENHKGSIMYLDRKYGTILFNLKYQSTPIVKPKRYIPKQRKKKHHAPSLVIDGV
ncbi:unnamed protein product [Caenorhabditis bovis]|uniref:Serine/threonine specific protein phosphatases domain-containing protein n=1 Tax=Caenorhabditis bovis TaxID=2654633 RepID=A0A8S1EF63_9PELO|nr:unnamed protein product [Caenorhabditis bovis]